MKFLRLYALALAVLAILLALPEPARAWTEGTSTQDIDSIHNKAVRQARAILLNDGFRRTVDFLDQANALTGESSYWKTLERVSWEADFATTIFGIPLSAARHYWHARQHRGLEIGPCFQSAGDHAQTYFDKAVSFWNVGDYGNAIHALGIAVHVVQDQGVPHHAAANPVDGHAEYESWADAQVNSNPWNYHVSMLGIYDYSPKNVETWEWVPSVRKGRTS